MGHRPPQDISSEPRFAAGCAWVAGAYLPIGEAAIPLTDWGFIRSDATYDVVSVRGGRFFRLDDHLDRFAASLARLRLTCPVSRVQLTHILAQCVRRAGLRDAYVSMTVTRGRNLKGSRDPRDCRNALYCFALPYVSILPAGARDTGLSVHICDIMRVPESAFDPRVKSYQWGDMLLGTFEAYDAGAMLPVLRDGEGHITEGPGFNFFALTDGRWHTPARGVLEGITRRTAIALIGSMGGSVCIAPLSTETVLGAGEAFITSTAGGIMAVTRINATPVGDGRPGPQTGRVRAAYERLLRAPALTRSVDDIVSAAGGEQAVTG